MHLRPRPIRLTIPLLLLSSLPGYSQALAPEGPAFTPSCIVRSVDRPCPSAHIPIPYPSPAPLTFESMEREAALAESWPAPAPSPKVLRTTAAPAQYEQSPRAAPDAPDQSELLKNSKDRDFILRNFKTMYVNTGDIKYFDEHEMKAALGRNPDFEKLNIRIVDDRRVADVVLIVSYTFAWDYPFELRHQNTTTVLLAGKGEGPFSGPLGAADVAREFVELAKPWRTAKEQKK
jgi:hypothetical protein